MAAMLQIQVENGKVFFAQINSQCVNLKLKVKISQCWQGKTSDQSKRLKNYFH